MTNDIILYDDIGVFMDDLTEIQKNILKYVLDCIKYRSVTPTLRNICKEFNYKSINSAKCHVFALRKKGYLSQSKYSRIEIGIDAMKKVKKIRW